MFWLNFDAPAKRRDKTPQPDTSQDPMSLLKATAFSNMLRKVWTLLTSLYVVAKYVENEAINW
jgi:hypothetical protein